MWSAKARRQRGERACPASSRAIERGRRRGSLGDPVAQLAGLEHLRLGPEAEQLAIRDVEALEAHDHPPVGLDALVVAEVAADVRGDANDHLDPRAALLERPRPLVPELYELEAGRRLASLLQRPHAGHARDAIAAPPDRP